MSGPPGTTCTPKLAFAVDPSKAPEDQAVPLHNRWHPEIPVASNTKLDRYSGWNASSGPVDRSRMMILHKI
eukprot:jgi/Picre1/29794/NNA_005176.t1